MCIKLVLYKKVSSEGEASLQNDTYETENIFVFVS